MAKNKEQMDKDNKKRYDTLKAQYRQVMQTESGKAVIWDILNMCDLYANVFTGNSHTFFLEGHRDVGIQILHRLNAVDPRLYPKLLMEKAENA